MKKKFLVGCSIFVVVLVVIALILVGYVTKSYNTMISYQEEVSEKWSQVENVYQRRMDLIPNLVETVRGYAEHERETFQAVTEARSQAKGIMQVPENILNNPEMFNKFQEAQSQLSGALQRLMVVVERYPELKANENFLSLQDQLEGTENRITVERRRFNETARKYNTYIKQFPRNIIANIFGFGPKPYFKAEEGAEKAPEVKF